MKKLLFIFSFLVLFNANTKAQYTWQALPNAPRSFRFDDMFFLNPSKGWAINPCYNYMTPKQYGEVFTTNDGGQTWKKIFDSSMTFIRSVGFIDNLNGWFGNLADTSKVNGIPFTKDTMPFYKTTDGGAHWVPVTNIVGPKPKGICGISVVNDSVVYAYGRYYGPAVIMKTTNKGQIWTSQSLGNIASGLVDGYFLHPDTGFVVGSYDSTHKSTILSTFDGGKTWQVRYRSTVSNETVGRFLFRVERLAMQLLKVMYSFMLLNLIQLTFLKRLMGD